MSSWKITSCAGHAAHDSVLFFGPLVSVSLRGVGYEHGNSSKTVMILAREEQQLSLQFNRSTIHCCYNNHLIFTLTYINDNSV